MDNLTRYADGQGAILPDVEGVRRLPVENLTRLVAILDRRPRSDPAPIRTVHHFACTGGTLFSKGVQSQPNTLVLSEVDPLSSLHTKTRQSRFAPTDPILLARNVRNPIDTDTAVSMFRASIGALYERLSRTGRNLVLRDHAHSRFCTETPWRERPGLREMVEELAPVRSIVTVRHPIDSWLALAWNDWRHFSPFCLEEYAIRYLAFLDAHSDLPLIRYETFTEDPDRSMREICDILELRFNPDWKMLICVMNLSGDSGRRSHKITPRCRRIYTSDLVKEAADSQGYRSLCARLGYEAALEVLPISRTAGPGSDVEHQEY